MDTIDQLSYALDTFYFLISGALVMWMAAGFAMLEAGLVRSKNTVEILTKNVALFAVTCTMYLLCGYQIMYPGANEGGISDALLTAQLMGIGSIFVWVFGTSLVVWGVIKVIMGIRISEEEECVGGDISECDMEAYPEFMGKS